MQISLFAAVLFGSSHALTLGSVPAAHATRAAAAPRMMFGGGGDKKEGGGFMDQLKAAKDMCADAWFQSSHPSGSACASADELVCLIAS